MDKPFYRRDCEALAIETPDGDVLTVRVRLVDEYQTAVLVPELPPGYTARRAEQTTTRIPVGAVKRELIAAVEAES